MKSASFALVLHELATNAVKYGAWSVDGMVQITWQLESHIPQGRQLALLWKERNGPLVSSPARQGLGSELIRKALPNATVDHRLEPSGLECTIQMPL